MKRDKPKRPAVTLKDRSYQPTKAEKEEEFSVNVPGKTAAERMDNFGKMVTRPVNLRYRKP